MNEIVKCGSEHLDLPQEETKKEQGKRITKPLFKFEHTYDPEKKQVFLRHVDKDSTNSTMHLGNKVRTSLNAALGSEGEEYTHEAFTQLMNAHFSDESNISQKANAAMEALIEMKPNDIFEGQLCSKLVMLADQYNELMRRAVLADQPLEIRERYINSATKLMRLHNETIETLNKHRRKGEQKVTVQHVYVNGGQALVTGQFNQAGEGDNQKGKGAAHV